MDIVSPKQRSRIMAAVPQRDSAPELIVRRMSHAMGFRYRLHVRSLPGSPDIVFPRLRKVIFVHGCFWHRHRCKRATTPATRRRFWLTKFEQYSRDSGAGIHSVKYIYQTTYQELIALRDRLDPDAESLPSSNEAARLAMVLGVSGEFEFQGESERRNTGDFYSVDPVVAKFAKNEWLRSAAQTVLPRRVHQGLRKFLARRTSSRATTGRWRLNEAEQELILQDLSSDLKRLVHHYGVDAEGVWSIPLEYLRD